MVRTGVDTNTFLPYVGGLAFRHSREQPKRVVRRQNDVN
jgi:hypothetical protein